MSMGKKQIRQKEPLGVELDGRAYTIQGMPEEMKNMVEKEVEKQMKKRTIHFSLKKTAIAVLAATLVIGTTAFAGSGLQRMYSESQGKYGAVTKIQTAGTESDSGETKTRTTKFPNVKLTFHYLPEGMVPDGQGKYSYEDTLYEGGMTPTLYQMDVAEDEVNLKESGVIYRENFNAGGHDGVYMQIAVPDNKVIDFDKRVYVYFEDVHYMLYMYLGENVSKEDAIKIAEGAELTETEEQDSMLIVERWSDYVRREEEEPDIHVLPSSINKEQVKKLYHVGDTFTIDGLDMTVTDVKICDDVSLLDKTYMDKEIYDEIDKNGKLLPNQIRYIKSGDGINALDKVVKTRTVNQKLVYVTVDYTNRTDEEIPEYLYSGDIKRLKESNDTYDICEETCTDGTWDVIENSSRLISDWASVEMEYYDARDSENNPNYIMHLKAGETRTVHMGFFVTEEDLPHLYLDLNPMGYEDIFENARTTGLVDITQK